MVVLKNSALGLNFQFHDLAKNHTLFNGNVYPTKNFRHGLKNSTLITQAKCNSSPSGLRPSGLEFAFCFRDSGGIFQSITQIFVGFPQCHPSLRPIYLIMYNVNDISWLQTHQAICPKSLGTRFNAQDLRRRRFRQNLDILPVASGAP